MHLTDVNTYFQAFWPGMEQLKPIKFAKAPLHLFGTSGNMWKHVQNHVREHRKDEFGTICRELKEASQKSILESHFMLNYTWCVYVSGFKATTVTKKWIPLLLAHEIQDYDGNYCPAQAMGSLMRLRPPLMEAVYAVWANKAKAKAVQTVRKMIFSGSWEWFRDEYLEDRDPEKIGKLPFMGPALRYHLARNLGNLDVVKPDVHLKRLASHYGFESPEALCRSLSDQPIGITDLALWIASSDLGT